MNLPENHCLMSSLKNHRRQSPAMGPRHLMLCTSEELRYLFPKDWHHLAKVCLPGGHFLLSKMEYEEEAKKEVGTRKRRGYRSFCAVGSRPMD